MGRWPADVTRHVIHKVRNVNQRLKMLLLMLGLTTAVLVLAACGDQANPSYPTTPVAPRNESSVPAPDFQVIAYQGQEILRREEVKFSDLLAQGRPVVLNF